MSIIKMKKPVYYIFLFALFMGCYYDVEEDFRMDTECNTDNITYSEDILNIVSNRCYKCHAASLNLGNVTLEGYDKISIYVNSGRLLGAIRREPGYSPMPQNESMLPDCDIRKIETWVNDGAPNN